MRWWTTIVLAVLAAVGAWLAFGDRPAPVRILASPSSAAVPEALEPAHPAAPLVEPLPTDPPESRRLACNGRWYGEGESMPKCGRG